MIDFLIWTTVGLGLAGFTYMGYEFFRMTPKQRSIQLARNEAEEDVAMWWIMKIAFWIVIILIISNWFSDLSIPVRIVKEVK